MRAFHRINVLTRTLIIAGIRLRHLATFASRSSGTGGSVLLGLFSVAIIWLGAWHMAREDASTTEIAAYHDAENLARAFEENIIRLIQAHDQILLFARTSYVKGGPHFDLRQWASGQRFLTDVSFQIIIIDQNGMLAGTTLGMPVDPMDLSDREHFRVHVDTNQDELFISKPVLGRVSSKWSIQLSRRIAASDGSFGGVVVVSIDPYYLANFYSSIDVQKDGMVLLAGLDGIVRVRVSAGNRTVGQALPAGALFKSLARTNSASFLTSGRLDGVPRLTSFRRVKGYPLVVAVGLSRAEVFAGADKRQLIYYGVAGLVSLLALVFMAMIVRRQIRLQAVGDKLWKAANFDALTGLPNRSRLYEAVTEIIADPRSQEQFAVLLLDLDNFKIINDTLGHEAGDLLLRTAAKRIKRMSRGAYLVVRLGGDEFAVVLRGATARQEIESVARRILHAVRRKTIYRGHSIESSISIGVARFPDHAMTWGEIFRAADLALYRAKQLGRNCVVVFEPEMLAEAERRFEVLKSMRSAIDGGRIVPHYQPQVSIVTGEVIGFEALARIRLSDNELEMPVAFMSALEDPEVGRAFGVKMMELVIRDMKIWRDSGLDFKHIAVNASNFELRAEDYSRRVLAMLGAAGLAPELLEIEITETAAFDDNIATIGRNLEMLASHGVSIALDDFGTGFASLSHLKLKPIAKIKIDRSFIENIATDLESRSIVEAIVRLSHSLGKSVVAEGVEDEDQAGRLRSLGCDSAQGFLFAKPLLFDEVGSFLLRHLAITLASSAHRRNARVGAMRKVR
jgi:diguanylate cyclase (GGDEF)-like protein